MYCYAQSNAVQTTMRSSLVYSQLWTGAASKRSGEATGFPHDAMSKTYDQAAGQALTLGLRCAVAVGEFLRLCIFSVHSFEQIITSVNLCCNKHSRHYMLAYVQLSKSLVT